MTDLETLTVASVAEQFVPVIFANGEDDDVPGLVAAIENRHVQFEEKIYSPGEALRVEERKLYLSVGLYIIAAGSAWPTDSDGWLVVREGNPSRSFTIRKCRIRTPIASFQLSAEIASNSPF